MAKLFAMSIYRNRLNDIVDGPMYYFISVSNSIYIEYIRKLEMGPYFTRVYCNCSLAEPNRAK